MADEVTAGRDGDQSGLPTDEPCPTLPSPHSGVQAATGPLEPGSAGPEPTPALDRIGPYHVLATLGEGGMGAVYLAQQVEPLRRQVAVKVLRSALSGPAALLRFEAEGQALARMSHPNVAQVYEAGTTPQGVPFIAMEHVPGQPITAYCDRHRLGLRERLELFCQACRGLQHAHQKGVVHRDVKPSNLLVSEAGDRPLVKVIDFGIAKGVGPSLRDDTRLTVEGSFLGTPAYMSPEALGLAERASDLDTRADVYGLGVLLYELLVGRRPCGGAGASLVSIAEEVRRGDAPPPSSRLAGLPEEARLEVARARGLTPDSLHRRLRGDLDWVTSKALAFDREQRYESPAALAEDVTRHLESRPVLVGPPALAYRMGRFARRHRTGVTAGLLAGAALAAGLAGTTTGLVRARRAEVAARQEAATARRVSEFLTGMFEVADPIRDREAGTAAGDSVTARDVLAQGTARLRRDLAGEPEVLAQLLGTVGLVHLHLGLHAEAEELLREALALRRRQLGPEHEEVAESLASLGILLCETGRYEEAERALREALATQRRLLGQEHLAVARSLLALGDVRLLRGALAEAEALVREALAVRRRLLGPEHPAVAEALQDLGWIAQKRGASEAAERLLREALAMRRRLLGDEHPRTLATVNGLALALVEKGDYAGAEALHRQALELDRKHLGDGHAWVAVDLKNLAAVVRKQGRFEEAEGLLREALAIRQRVLGDGHPLIASTVSALALLEKERGNLEAAESLAREALARKRRALGEEHPDVVLELNNLALVLMARGQLEEAERIFRRVLDVRRRTLGDDHVKVAVTLGNLGMLLKDKRDYAAAEPLLREALAIDQRRLGERHPDVAIDLNNVALVLELRGAHEEAEPLVRQALDVYRSALPPGHWRIAVAESILAACQSRRGRHAEAEPLLLASLQAIEARTGMRSSYSRDARLRVVALYERWGRPAQAASYRRSP